MKHKGDTEKLGDLGILMGAHDWKEAMKYAKFTFSDIEKILVAIEGENDEAHWKLIVKLKSGKIGWLDAWCDYSGWGCQEGGKSGIVDDYDKARLLIREIMWNESEKIEFDIECTKGKDI